MPADSIQMEDDAMAAAALRFCFVLPFTEEIAVVCEEFEVVYP